MFLIHTTTMAIINQIDIDDFIGEFSLSTSTYSDDVFDSFVTQKQYELLLNIFGAGLYNAYVADPTDTDWVAFRDGEAYTDLNGYTQNWDGLSYLMLPYIYSLYIKFNVLKAVQSGIAKPRLENADVASEYEWKSLMFDYWNMFIDRYNEAYIYLMTKYTNDATKYTDFYIHFMPRHKDGILLKGNVT